MRELKAQIVVVGGGIAGLWTHALLRKRGFDAVLVEKTALGSDQTLASQGMIHGGQRYNLEGRKTRHAELIAPMPRVWGDCLAGTGEIDLSGTRVLEARQFMWSPGGLLSNVSAFVGSRILNTQTENPPREEWPEVFRMTKDFRGRLYRMNEVVLDAKSLVRNIAEPGHNHIYRVEIEDIVHEGDRVRYLAGRTGENDQITLHADTYIFAAGTFNEVAADALGIGKSATQRRPLRQVMVGPLPYRLYAHCITTDPRPRVTVTAHPLPGGDYVWYLGGLVAVRGADTSDDEAIDFARKEMAALFPAIDWDRLTWDTWYGDRAEPAANDGFLPDGPEIKTTANAALVWPTKLTFAPAVGTLVANWIDGLDVAPRTADPLDLPACPVGQYPWEGREWR
ncbi:MAG: FAD-dependent oxidoreductase [Alphaproteobacteria bacterium]|nr:FAD-dependent oxidoreductase [Alphaproteobacteria bacterium]